jgi:hypothetical protein
MFILTIQIMKKLLFAVLMLTSAGAFSQGLVSGLKNKLEFGIKAGVGYSDFVNANFATDPLVGYHFGGTIGFKLNDRFSIREDILYSMQGAKTKSDILGKQDIKLHYMTIPILLRYKTRSGFYVEGGAQAAMLIKEDVPGLTSDQKFAKKVDAGAVGGIGFQSKMGLGVGVRYIYGFTKIGDTGNPIVKPDFTTSAAQASISYTF